MDRDRIKRIYALHTGTGLVLGWLLFAVCFSGSIAMLEPEIAVWENPEQRRTLPAEPVPVHPLVARTVAEAGGRLDNLFVSLPTREAPFVRVQGVVPADDAAENGEQGERVVRHFDARTGAAEPVPADGPAHWLLDLHRHMNINRTIGRALVGATGVFMLLSVLTGIITHRKILSEAFTLRWQRNRRLRWKDLHNTLGTWTLPFGVVIAFSGAFLGLVVILLPVVALGAFKGDQEAVLQAVTGPPLAAAGRAADLQPLDVALAAVARTHGVVPRRVSIEHWGDAHARYHVFADPGRHLVQLAEVDVDAVSGQVQPVDLTGSTFPDTVAARVLAALTPLHYGTYGGLPLKLLYLVLGLALAVMIASGMAVWVERRHGAPTGARPDAVYARVGRLNTGVMAGFAIASVVLLPVDRLVAMHSADREAVLVATFLGSWLLAIGWAACDRDLARVNRGLLGGLALVCLAVPTVDLASSTPAQWLHIGPAVVNCVAAIAAAALMPVALRLGRAAGVGRRSRRGVPAVSA